MKALTVKQPWAWALIHGGKDVENRSRPTKHRGQLFIHAGKGWADEGIDGIGIEGMPADEELLAGMVIGTVDVIDCHHATECQNWAESGSLCTEWAMPEHFHWVLKNARPVEIPFAATGKLGLWNLEDQP
ncbi:ASCH domain-containing protein [Paenarthrobacter nitroguajacolicus]|uniref:ASCH domain-containing protein n=1 Tax=Paenarthrobacter nitroguajacolicus TaxID=211146 RepID=UPI0015B8FF23|nr:ASCH domain-containing protein [Paenarthrobacter nitroguajacolicus]NWL34472.1 hypothetical protein [Paenarthrobacter nitroguajacolicus]